MGTRLERAAARLRFTAWNLTLRAYPHIFVLAVAAVILALPMLLYGPMPNGHDTPEHLSFFRHFTSALWGGELYPRWLSSMNHGLGSPTFFVYPPFPSYIAASLVPVGTLLHFNAFNAAEFLALLGSGLSAFLWISTIAKRGVALACGVVFMLLPYHLAVDFYFRDALSECWALVWMPLVLYFVMQILKDQRGALVGLAVSYCLLILSHLVSVIIFSPIPFLVAVTSAAPSQKIRSTLTVTAGMVLGTGLSGFYFFSALHHAKYFPVASLQINVREHLLHFGKQLESSDYFIQMVTWSLIGTATFIFLGGMVALKKGSSSRTHIALWMALCVVPIFLMWNRSLPLWVASPFLHDAMQYPWRLNIVLCLAVLPVAAALLSELSWPPSFGQVLSVVLVLLLAVTSAVMYGEAWKRYDVAWKPRPPTVNEHDGWFAAWTPRGMDPVSALEASAGPQVRFLAGEGIASVLLWRPRHIEFQSDSKTSEPVVINQLYYPEWTAEEVDEGRQLEIRAALPTGLLQVQVPPGHHRVRLQIPVELMEIFGRWATALCVLLCIAMLRLPKLSIPRRRS